MDLTLETSANSERGEREEWKKEGEAINTKSVNLRALPNIFF